LTETVAAIRRRHVLSTVEVTMTAREHPVPSESDVRSYLVDRRNWGRWGADDQRGAVNLVTTGSRLRALATARTGEAISLSRALPTWTGAGNIQPAQHYMKTAQNGGQNTVRSSPNPPGGWATDYYGMSYHGVTTTHIDALCHVWDGDGIFNGRQPERHITYDGATFGGIEQWSDGIVTRGVILDVPRFRGTEYVTQDAPVHGWELEEILDQRGIELQPGDAVCVYSGRERWQMDNPEKPYGRYPVSYLPSCSGHGFEKPGLHASCLPFLRDHDVASLVWDMLDMTPYQYDIPYSVHGAIHAYGIAMVDNALLEPLAATCAAQDRSDFLLVILPLVVNGGTGSPVNPLAIL
jgi:kynurenine formamidase